MTEYRLFVEVDVCSIMRGDLGLLGASACIRQVMIRRSRRCPSIRSGIRQVMTRRIRVVPVPGSGLGKATISKIACCVLTFFNRLFGNNALIRCRPDVLRATA